MFAGQGHYALDQKVLLRYPPADLSVERIGDLLEYSYPAFMKPVKDSVNDQVSI